MEAERTAVAEQVSAMLRAALPPPPATLSTAIPEVLEFALQAARGADVAAELLQQAELVLNAKRRLHEQLVDVLEQLAAHSPTLQTEEALWAVTRRLLDTGLHTIHAVTGATPETQAALGPGGAELYAKALQAWADRILPTRFRN